MQFRPAFFALALTVPMALVGQVSKTVPKAAPGVPTAAPTPTPASLAGKSTKPPAIAAVIDLPVHAPQQLEFAAVWNGQSSRRTFGLATTAAGAVSAQIPAGPFRIVEFRLMSGPALPADTLAARVAGGSARQVEFRQSYTAGQPAPSQWNVGANQDIEIDVLFEPKFDLFSMTAGPKSAAMRVTGPGPRQPWTLSVPMQGMFTGLHIEAIFTVDDKELLAVSPTTHLDVGVRLVGVDTAVKGTVQGKAPPAGVSVGSVPVSVNPKQTITAKVPVTLAWNALTPDGKNRDVSLTLEAPGVSSTATFSIVPVPGTVSAGGQPTDCGIAWLGWSAILFPDGHLVYNLNGNNRDLINVRDVLTTLSVGGRVVAWGYMHLDFDPGGKLMTSFNQWNSANVNANFASRFSTADYVPAVRGGVAFSCKLVNFDFKPPF